MAEAEKQARWPKGVTYIRRFEPDRERELKALRALYEYQPPRVDEEQKGGKHDG